MSFDLSHKKTTILLLKLIFPILVLTVSIFITFVLIKDEKPVIAEVSKQPELPKLSTYNIVEKQKQFTIKTQGVVHPKFETTLTAQVSGVITKTANDLKVGDRFEKGDFLFQIDARDYELSLATAKANVASAKQKLIKEQAESKLAKLEWKKYGKGSPSPLTLRIPQLNEAKANLEAAKSEQKKALLALSRTTIVAPYAGTIREKMSAVGQYVSSGTNVAKFFSDRLLEVRLPVTRRQLDSLSFTEKNIQSKTILIRDPQRKNTLHWVGQVIGMEKEIQKQTNQYMLIANVSSEEKSALDPLLSGTFVFAEIKSEAISNMYRIPASALYMRDSILVVDHNDFVRQFKIDIHHKDMAQIYFSADIKLPTKILTQPPEIFVEGMKIRTNSNGAVSKLDSIKNLADINPDLDNSNNQVVVINE
ncbi:efflux RND transporter periplasmic adaptor subunit [Kiloniella sp. EL199]|uniref:efflux RND transporter periplasmic adaptor subunit n=1 Tax=Kiloniella sp. EL199 TaxID=2107581 RepID=UPI000EA1CC8B|nr:efflux RND transporter periplasmic adaptor subunit [Kiloniella sp. EL199]